MKTPGMVIALCLALFMQEAYAVRVKSTALTPRQIGQTQNMQVGLSVQGWTETQVLTVGGAFEVNCPQGLTIQAQKLMQSAQVRPGFSFTVTVPGWVPAQYEIPGWNEWTAPVTKTCTFVYIGRAIEDAVTIGAFGIRISLGGGEAVDGNTITFNVAKPQAPPPAGNCRSDDAERNEP